MSADSSELTFVRCPSCRSLVPAASSRCKMCGAGLDANAQADQSEEERKKTGRVRQNTLTRPSAGTQARGPAEQPSPADDFDDEDPFDIFSDDADDDVQLETADGGEDLENPLGSYLPEDQADEQTLEQTPERQAPAPSASVGQQQSEAASRSPRVSIESGGRPAGKPSSLNFGKNRNEQTPQQTNAAGRRPEPKAEPRRDSRQEMRGAREEQKPFASAPKQEAATERREQVNQHAGNEKGDQHRGRSGGGRPEAQKAGEGRLFGWFVSYDSAEGDAIELREGRFFISGSKLKDNDLVIADKGLSTPHALVSINSKSGLRMQDLMSEDGLHVRRNGSEKYQKEEATVVLEHGDWVKFGDVEFLIAVISNNMRS